MARPHRPARTVPTRRPRAALSHRPPPPAETAPEWVGAGEAPLRPPTPAPTPPPPPKRPARSRPAPRLPTPRPAHVPVAREPRQRRPRRALRRAAVLVAVLAGLLAIGAAITPWEAGRPLRITSSAAHLLVGLRSVQSDQARFAHLIAGVSPDQTSLPALQATSTSLESLGATLAKASLPALLVPAATAIQAEVTDAEKVVGYLADAAQSGILPSAEYDPALAALSRAEQDALAAVREATAEVAP